MSKAQVKPYTAIFPCPVVLVSVPSPRTKGNLITLAWVANVCSIPPKVGISIRPHRYSSELIKKYKEFVVNIPTEALLEKVDFCGTVSGRSYNKFEEANLTRLSAERVKAPLVKECPVNIECKLEDVIPLGSHDLFIGVVLTIHVDENIVERGGRINYQRIRPIAYLPEDYYSVRKPIGTYGFTKGKL